MQSVLHHPSRVGHRLSSMARSRRAVPVPVHAPQLPHRLVPINAWAVDVSTPADGLKRAEGSPTSSGCFALETMEQDGQAWVWDELGQRVVGLTRRTSRAQVRTTSLLHYDGDLEEGTKSRRCQRLDLTLGWEATANAAKGHLFTGQARVSMCNRDNLDTVSVDVQVDPACLAAAEAAAAGGGAADPAAAVRRAVADVEFAVKGLDGDLMVQISDFLWSMESHNSLASVLDSSGAAAGSE